MTGTPRSVSCARVMPESTSALCTTSVPARVTGAEPPAMAIERMQSDRPRRAHSMITSVASRGSLSGLTGQVPKLTTWSSRSASRPPTMQAPSSAQTRTSQPLVASAPTGLAAVEQRRLAAVHGGRRGRHVGRPDRGGVAVDVGAARRPSSAASAASALRGSRRSPLRGSTYMTPSSKLLNVTGPSVVGRAGGDRRLDDLAGKAHHPGLAIDARAAVGEDVERLVVLDEDAGLFEHLAASRRGSRRGRRCERTSSRACAERSSTDRTHLWSAAQRPTPGRGTARRS